MQGEHPGGLLLTDQQEAEYKPSPAISQLVGFQPTSMEENTREEL